MRDGHNLKQNEYRKVHRMPKYNIMNHLKMGVEPSPGIVWTSDS
jgi:hypothetical protein